MNITDLSAIFSGIFIFIALKHSLLGFIQKKEKSSLIFAVFVIAIAAFEISSYCTENWSSILTQHFYRAYQFLFFQLGCIVYLLFLSVYTKIIFRKLLVPLLVISVILLLSIFYLLHSGSTYFQFPNDYKTMVAIGTLLFVYLFSFNAYAFTVLFKHYAKSHNNFNLLSILAFTVYFFAQVNDILVVIGILKLRVLLFGYLSLTGVTSLSLSKDYIKTSIIKKRLKLQQQERNTKEESIHMIIHDLKMPLNVLMNISTEMPKEVIHKKVSEYTHKMQFYTQGIIDLCNSEDGFLKLEKKECSITDIIWRAYNLSKPFLKAKNISFNYDAKKKYIVNVDDSILERVIINLLSNAIKYTQQNGEINVSIIEKLENTIEIRVQDNGIGIAENKLSAVFNKFEYINKQDNSLLQSTGLGLSFCKAAIEAHQGSLILESVNCNGTIAKLTLLSTQANEKGFLSRSLNNLKYSKKIILSRNEQAHLTKIYPEILKLELNEATLLRRVIKRMESDKHVNQIWLNALKTANQNFDKQLFLLLTNDIKATNVTNNKIQKPIINRQTTTIYKVCR